MERGHTPVEEGRLLHERTYGRTLRKERWIGGLLRIDYTTGGLLVEVKRSSRLRRAARYQLLFYLYALKRFIGWSDPDPFPIAGEIRYPRERRKERLVLTPQAEAEVEALLQQIQTVEASPTPPSPTRLTLCPKCAYAQFCWG